MRKPSQNHFANRLDSIAMARSEAERRAGHLDHVERGRLLADIEGRQDALAMSRAQVHGHVGLDPGTLDDSSMSTRCLRETLRILRLMQHPVQS